MEKVIYCLTNRSEADPEVWSKRLSEDLSPALNLAGAHAVYVNVPDDAVARAAALRIVTSQAPPDAVISVWVDSAVDQLRQPFDELVAAQASSVSAYLVTESVPIPNTRFPDEPGERTEGFAQLAFIRKATSLSGNEFLDVWLNSHTQIAIDTQDTFLYVQNVVTRVLTPGATPWDAIVEEGFPSDAMDDPNAFFDAIGDDDRLSRHQQEMFASVQRFIDLSAIDVIPTSRYPMSSLAQY